MEATFTIDMTTRIGSTEFSVRGTQELTISREAGAETVIDLAVFYGRNTRVLNGDVGWVPGNVFGTVVDGLDELADAGNDLWRTGAAGERLEFRRVS